MVGANPFRSTGTIMKATRLLIASAVAALLPFAGAVAQTPPPAPDPTETPQPPSQQGATFESLDTNGDGKISKTEASANANVSEQFSRYDQNGDGYIERAEVTSANSTPKTPEEPKK